MRLSELMALPGTPSEAKNSILDLMAVYQGKNLNEIPIDIILKTLHRQNYDVDRRLVIDLIQNEPNVKRISGNVVYLNMGDDDLEPASQDEEEKSKKKVKQMAKKSLKKKIGE